MDWSRRGLGEEEEEEGSCVPELSKVLKQGMGVGDGMDLLWGPP